MFVERLFRNKALLVDVEDMNLYKVCDVSDKSRQIMDLFVDQGHSDRSVDANANIPSNGGAVNVFGTRR
jgi:hypothetical protein